MSSIRVDLAKLYLDAEAIDQSRAQLDDLLKIFPSYAYAKLIAAQANLASGNEDVARALLTDALDVWSEADAEFVHKLTASSLLDSF